jgi:hypothetical protein
MTTCGLTADVPTASRGTYRVVEQEVNIGATAFKSGNGQTAVTFFRSALQKLTPQQPFYDHLVHNLLLSYRLSAEGALKAGDIDAAQIALRGALSLELRGGMAGNPDFRYQFASAFQELGLVLFHHRLFDESVLCSRKAIAICPTPGSHINLLNALAITGKPAILSDFTSDITPDKLGHHIFIACAPKSGSTFLKNVLASITGYRDVFMVYTPGQFEQDVYLPTIRSAATFDSITQQHCRASDANVHLMQAFSIKPVVLVRDIFDSVMSLFDFYNNGAFATSFYRADYLELDEETRIDLLIDNLVPWYFEFITSWADVEKNKRLEVHWLTYEELVNDKASAIEEVLRFYGLGAPRNGIDQRVREVESERRKTRFNKGVSGRGSEGLTERQKDRIRGLHATIRQPISPGSGSSHTAR